VIRTARGGEYGSMGLHARRRSAAAVLVAVFLATLAAWSVPARPVEAASSSEPTPKLRPDLAAIVAGDAPASNGKSW
jgi:hypothetical protein